MRHASVDALRGLTVAAMVLVNDPGDWGHVYAPLRHAEWNGCTPADLIFPFFLFIVGVSIALGGAADARTVLLRALRLVALGLVLNLVAHLSFGTPALRIPGVLQRIGLCYAATALLASRTSVRTQWAAIGALLAGYALLLAAAPMTRDANLPGRLDAWLLGPHAYEFDPSTGAGHDPEGLLGTLPAIASTLFGVRCGVWLKGGALRYLAIVASAAVLVGCALAPLQSFNKSLWTPSYAVFSGGLAALALLLAHRAVDLGGAPAIGRDLGRNAIAVYAFAWLAACVLDGSGLGPWFYRVAFGGLGAALGPHAASLGYAVVFVAMCWLFAHELARRGVRIRI